MLVIGLTAAGWRAWGLADPSFDHDEVYELTHRAIDLGELAGRHDGFPPLYRWLLAWVVEITQQDLAARWFSLVAGVATVVTTGLLGRVIAGPFVGLVSAGLIAISAHHVLLSQHARGYALMVFFCSLMLLTAWRLRRSDRLGDWAAFLCCSWLAAATHYFSGLLLVLLGGMLLIEKRGIARRRALVAAGLLAIAGLPLVACLRIDLAETGEFFHRVAFDKEAYAFTYLGLITGQTLGPSVSELRELVSLGRGREAILGMAPWAAAVAAAVGVLMLAGWGRLAPRDRYWLLVLLIAPPLLALGAASIAPTGYNYRYIAWMIVPLCVWLATGVVESRRQPLMAVATLLLIGLGLEATYNRQLDPRYHEHDLAGVVSLIERLDTTENGAPAVVAAPLYYGSAVLFALPEEWPSIKLPAHPDRPRAWGDELARFAELAGPREEVWLVMQWFPKGHPQRPVCDALAERLGAELVERVSSTVMVYRAPASAPTRNGLGESEEPGREE